MKNFVKNTEKALIESLIHQFIKLDKKKRS